MTARVVVRGRALERAKHLWRERSMLTAKQIAQVMKMDAALKLCDCDAGRDCRCGRREHCLRARLALVPMRPGEPDNDNARPRP